MTNIVKNVKNVSIKEYLENRGYEFSRKAGIHFCSSPFSNDSKPSFAVYADNTFYCYSSGKGGDVIQLVQDISESNGKSVSFKEAVNILSDDKFLDIKKSFKKKKEKDKSFIIPYTYDKDIRNAVKRYAKSRGFDYGYECGVFHDKYYGNVPAMMFIHTDKNGKPTGVRLRNALNKGLRFKASGKLNFCLFQDKKYNEESLNRIKSDKPKVYVCESETSSLSLHHHLNNISQPHIIISIGAVTQKINELPDICSGLEKHLIIDYDGDEEVYNDRLKNFSHLDLKNIKIPLEKGEDLNTIYLDGTIKNIKF